MWPKHRLSAITAVVLDTSRYAGTHHNGSSIVGYSIRVISLRCLVGAIALLACAFSCSAQRPTGSSDAGRTTTSDGSSSGTSDGGSHQSRDSDRPADAGIPTPIDGRPLVCSEGVVEITERCPAFDACGGELPQEGEFCYRRVCIERTALINWAFSAIVGCATDQIRVTDPRGTVSGKLTFANGQVRRRASTSIAGSFYLPSSCTGSIDCATFAFGVQLNLRNDGTIRCTAASGGCDCDMTVAGSTDATSEYATRGARLELPELARSYEYCRDGADLTLRDVSATNPEPGDQVFGR